MIKLEFDYKELERYDVRLGASVEQIPFALATAMNRSADVTRNFLIKQTWPTHIKQRNASFIAASLTTKDARANKQSLSVEIYDRLNRGNLKLQAKGGMRVARRGRMAIPASNIPRGSRGVPTRLRPRNLQNDFKKRNMVFTRDKKGRAKLIYVLKSASKIPKRVPFYEDFAASMHRELVRTIPLAVAKAMSTRR